MSGTDALFAEERVDPKKLFYAANWLYENRDYNKALEEYLKIVDMRLGSGNLYYNIGNAFLKIGKNGYAVLYYEKARRLIPQDGDLKSNLAYARSLTGANGEGRLDDPFIVRIIKAPFKDLNLNALAVVVLGFYLFILFLILINSIIPYMGGKFKILFIVLVVLFAETLTAFSFRYYDEEVLKRGIVVVKSAEGKYEPIDKATTYYKLQEGDEVVIITTRNEWRHIRRPDGKSAWISKDAVEEI